MTCCMFYAMARSRYSPSMSLIGGFYFTDAGCHTGDSCANAKPLCCGHSPLFTHRPDLPLALDTVMYWFRNDGFIGGVNPCAPGGWSCKKLPAPYSTECVKNPQLCGCVLGPKASQCPWGHACKASSVKREANVFLIIYVDLID